LSKIKPVQMQTLRCLIANGDNYPDIYIASGGYTNLNEADALLQDRLYLNDGNNNFAKK